MWRVKGRFFESYNYWLVTGWNLESKGIEIRLADSRTWINFDGFIYTLTELVDPCGVRVAVSHVRPRVDRPVELANDDAPALGPHHLDVDAVHGRSPLLGSVEVDWIGKDETSCLRYAQGRVRAVAWANSYLWIFFCSIRLCRFILKLIKLHWI